MKVVLEHEKYGTINYEENAWNGRKQIYVNGVPLKRRGKNVFFLTVDGEEKIIKVKGSTVTGVSLELENESITVTPKAKWYEVALLMVSAVFFLVWGNVPQLCEIVPLIGGAIGGIIIALSLIATNAIMKKTDKAVLKIAIWLASFALTFLALFLVAMVFLSALA